MQSTIIVNYIRPDEKNAPATNAVIRADDVRVYQPASNLDSLQSAIESVIRANLKSQDPHPWWGWWYSPSSGRPVVGPGDTHMFGYRHTSKTPDFKERCSKGEILMNDYNVCKGILTYGPTERSELLRDDFIQWYTPNLSAYFPVATRNFLVERYGWWSREQGEFAFANGSWRQAGFGVYSGQFKVYQSARVVGKPYDPRVNYEDIGKYLGHFPQDIDHVTVQEVLAKANAGDLDVLTAMAEMPELISSIIDGFKLIKKIFQDAKKREFRLFATVPTRERRLASAAFAKKKAKALRKIPVFKTWKRRNPGGTLNDYRNWRSDRIDRIGDLEKFLAESGGVYRKRALREISEALASIHLNVMYNIKPTIYTIEDALSAFDNFDSEYRRYGNGNTPVTTDLELKLPGIPEAVFEGEAKQEFRCLIKRRYSVSDMLSKMNNVLIADVLLTGFELIRLWSIVFDWFFSISDMLRAIPWNRNYVQQAACVSWKTTINGQFSWSLGSENHTLKVEMEHFERSLYNPVHSIGIYFRDDFGLMQQLSALAFSFQKVNGSIRRRYSYS